MRELVGRAAAGILVAGCLVVAVGPASPASPTAGGPGGTCEGLAVTMLGTPGDDVLTGTPGDDVIAGRGGDDTIDGLAGDDVICGGSGTDLLRGGDGDDRLHGQRNGLRDAEDNPPDNVGDTLAGGPGDDLIGPGLDTETDADGGYLGDTVTYADSGTGVQVDLSAGTATGEGTDRLVWDESFSLVASAYDDVVLGTDGEDDITTGAGDDEVHAGRGRDQVADDLGEGAAASDDLFDGGGGPDYLVPGAGDDRVLGGGGDDEIEDGGGAARVLGGGGDDIVSATLVIGVPGQFVRGGPGADQVNFTVGRTDGRYVRRPTGTVNLAAGRAKVLASKQSLVVALASVQTVVLPNGRWTFRGTAKPETVFGGATPRSRLVARGGGGRDVLQGTPGDDVLLGGPGRDVADGSRGTDTCRSVVRAESCERG